MPDRWFASPAHAASRLVAASGESGDGEGGKQELVLAVAETKHVPSASSQVQGLKPWVLSVLSYAEWHLPSVFNTPQLDRHGAVECVPYFSSRAADASTHGALQQGLAQNHTGAHSAPDEHSSPKLKVPVGSGCSGVGGCLGGCEWGGGAGKGDGGRAGAGELGGGGGEVGGGCSHSERSNV